MFFTTFNPMTTEEVDAKVAAAKPKGGDGIGGVLAGKRFKLKLTGEFAPSQLDYSFGADGTLRVTENGEEYAAVPYGTIQPRCGIVLFTHTIPGTSRGWHIVIDMETSLTTAFETWFGITVPVGGDIMGTRPPTHYRDIPRETQRQYYFGYVDDGRLAPEKLHCTTNRIEGRGLLWEYYDGRRCLTFFPSVACSTFVSLDEPSDMLAVTYPSDFICVNDELYIYAKWGVEFGGEMWLNVIDFSVLKAVGVKFGFNEKDEFEYGLYTAALTVTGDAAHLEMITDYGLKPPMSAFLKGKGARYAYRPMDIDVPMTRAEAFEAAKKKTLYNLDEAEFMGANRLPFSHHLVGKRFALAFDHVETPYAWSAKNTPERLPLAYEYDFASHDELKWREPGGEWQTEKYRCFEPAKDIYFFSHMLTGFPDFANVTQAVDFSNGLATCVYARIGSWTSEWEASATCLFGTASGENIALPPFGKRHGFTTDLVGKSYAWSYSNQGNSIHVYSSPVSYSWSIFQPDNAGGATWSCPCFFIKLRDDAYLFQWIEEKCNGIQSIVCFNPRTMHDSGFSYGVNRHSGLQLNVMGAYARRLGSFDIMKYYDKSGV